MKYNLGYLLQFYYSSVLLITVLIIGIYGGLNLDNTVATIESGLQLEDIKGQNGIEEIETLIKDGRLEEAISYTKALQERVGHLNLSTPTKSFEEFNSGLREIKRSLVNLTSYSDLESIILTFDEKLNNFLSFVKKNQWRTLTRTTETIKSKAYSSIIGPKDFFNSSKLKGFYNFTSKDIESMERIVKKSFLSNQNKKNVMAKIKYLNIEIEKVEEYLFSIEALNSPFGSLNSTYYKWMNEIEPAIALAKIKIEKSNKKSTIIYWGILCFLIFSIILSYFVCRVSNLALRKKTGAIILDAIKKGLIPFKSNFDIDFGCEFKEEFEKYRECFHKRGNLGIFFQKAIPFGSALFDSNLNLIWANSLFYKHFGIEKDKTKNYLNWSFFQKETNLVEDDFILTTLKQGIAGIYQIQIKNNGNKKTDSYEIYIAPIEYEGQKKISMFLYPLNNVEETITNQKDLIISPISQMLDCLTNNIPADEMYKGLKKDFENSGILKVFEKFINYNNIAAQQKESFIEKIGELQSSLKYKSELKEESRDLSSNIKKINGLMVAKFKKSEESIVEYMETHKELEKQTEILLNFFEFLFMNKNNIVKNRETAEKIIEENLKTLKSTDAVKNKLKDFGSQLGNCSSKLSQLTEQISLATRNGDVDGGYLENKTEKMKFELKGIEAISVSFNEIMKSFDIVVSKAYLILEEWDCLDFDKLKKELKTFENDFKRFKEKLNNTFNYGKDVNQTAMNDLKDAYEEFQRKFTLEKRISQLLEIDQYNSQYNFTNDQTWSQTPSV